MNDKAHMLVLLTALGRYFIDNIIYSDDEDTESEDDMMDLTFLKIKRRTVTGNRPQNRIPMFVESIVSNCTGAQFQSNFRLSPAAFNHLLNQIAPDLCNNSESGGRHTIEPRRQLLSVIWSLATPESFRSVSDRFNMGKSTLHHCFVRVITVLNKFAPEIIRLGGIKNIIGVIDGTYIKIKAPQEFPETYINRKCYYGIILQAICDHSLIFTNCFAGYPSSVSDIRIFRNSDIYSEFIRNPNIYFPNNEFIIGDKVYPVTNWCIPPYIERRVLNNTEKYFNTRHAKTRQCIERAFALYFGRFRRMRDLDMSRVDMIPSTIVACCVLHNICLKFNDPMIEEYIREGMEVILHREYAGVDNEYNHIGIQKRDMIAI